MSNSNSSRLAKYLSGQNLLLLCFVVQDEIYGVGKTIETPNLPIYTSIYYPFVHKENIQRVRLLYRDYMEFWNFHTYYVDGIKLVGTHTWNERRINVIQQLTSFFYFLEFFKRAENKSMVTKMAQFIHHINEIFSSLKVNVAESFCCFNHFFVVFFWRPFKVVPNMWPKF